MNSEVDLDVCAREPIHIPGSIQGHGGLIAFDLTSGAITHVSTPEQKCIGWPE